MAENLWIDHVIFGTADMDAAAKSLEDRFGLASIVGGKHESIGTGNRIVPLGSAYLELMGVVDHERAAIHPFGRWFTRQIADGDRFLMWSVATDDIDAVAARLDLEIEEWTRATPDGKTLSWRMGGVAISNEHPELPFFIQWDVPPEMHPSHAQVDHQTDVTGFAEIHLSGDEERVRRWINDAALPVRFVTGRAGITGVTIATEEGDIALP